MEDFNKIAPYWLISMAVVALLLWMITNTMGRHVERSMGDTYQLEEYQIATEILRTKDPIASAKWEAILDSVHTGTLLLEDLAK